MKKEEISRFVSFLKGFTKKNGKKLGERTITGILILSKFIEPTVENELLESLSSKHKNYLESKNHPIARYSLWLYLKSLNYPEKIIKEVVSFRKRNLTALTDEEKLAASVLSKKELIFLVNCITNLRNKVLVKALYDSGARISEILNLTLKDIDFDSGEVNVMGKGRKPRTSFMHKSTIELLKLLIKSKNIVSPNSLIFTIKPKTAWYHVKKYGKK
jgi:integrase